MKSYPPKEIIEQVNKHNSYVYRHTTDFSALGYINEIDASKHLIQTIQEICRNMLQPKIFLGFEAFKYFQRCEMVSGFLTYCPDFVYVGELSTRNVPIQTVGIVACVTCGTYDNPENGKCVKCHNPHLRQFAGKTIPIFATSSQLDFEMATEVQYKYDSYYSKHWADKGTFILDDQRVASVVIQ